MALSSQITPYNEQWPSMFLAEKRLIADVFGSDLIAIHHVGSTAVIGLWAKPEIDLLVEVREHTSQAERDRQMVSLGYVRGSNLSHGHHFYRKDVDGVRTHKVHVCLTGHWQIERMIRFKDLLIDNAQIRQEYQRLKLHLEASNRDGIAEYLAKKAPFIDNLMGPSPE
ncbi:GrpB family protein [Agrobacterium rosae]|uniref:GrpB family protein n=1 Tax=Agrobacterium rosae TaxID=1972867 RepID=UPI002A110721|nr:GrpB family protein [Agrobacterium rosae]MDX8315923.1 GrpB family protein [Agrobacterium rosae]